MRIRYWATLVCMSHVLVTPLFAGNTKAVNEKQQKKEAAFVGMMNGFAKAEGLSEIIQPAYLCQGGREVCGLVNGNLEEFLRKRPDFVRDTYKFQRAHRGSTCSYRGKSGSVHYSLHIVCYGPEMAGVHMDVRLPEGWWGNFEHNVRDVGQNYFKIYVLRIKNSHTSEVKLAHNFNKWWQSYEAAYPEFAAREIPTEAESLLNGQMKTVQRSSLPGYARGFR